MILLLYGKGQSRCAVRHISADILRGSCPEGGTVMGKVDVPIIGEKQAASLGRVVISMLAIGISAGLTLIAAAKKIGDIIAEEKVK